MRKSGAHLKEAARNVHDPHISGSADPDETTGRDRPCHTGGVSGGTVSRGMVVGVFAIAITSLTLVPQGSSASGNGNSASDAIATPTVEPTSEPTTTVPASEPPPTTETTVPPIDPTTPAEPACSPATPLVDSEATPEATCLAATLDGWQATGSYGIGQQLNVSSADYLGPLDQLAPDVPAVVGFDLAELEDGETYGFAQPPLDALLALANEGVVLTASWHTPNPSTGLDAGDRSWQDLHALLDPEAGNGPSRRFWADYDAKLELLRRLQTGDDGLYRPAAVIFRPLHEANGNWFWWAQGTDPSDYKALYAAMQQRAADAGVHNIVWGWSPNAVTNDTIIDPMSIKPDRLDLAGVDSYEAMQDRGEQDQQLDLTGLSELASSVPRVAVTEAGPHGSVKGAWDPRVVPDTAVIQGLRPVYVMLWFDDGDGADGYTGKKQLGSLRGGKEWLRGCPEGVCQL